MTAAIVQRSQKASVNTPIETAAAGQAKDAGVPTSSPGIHAPVLGRGQEAEGSLHGALPEVA